MTEETKVAPNVGYQQALTQNGEIGVAILVAAPLVAGVIAGLILASRDPSYGWLWVIIGIGGYATQIGALMVLIGRRYVPFELAIPKADKW